MPIINKFVKFELHVVNIFLILCGVTLALLGLVVYVASSDSIFPLSESTCGISIALVVIGICLAIIGLFGVCGIMYNVFPMTVGQKLYFVLAGLIAIACMILAVLVYKGIDQFTDEWTNSMKTVMEDANNDIHAASKELEALQLSYKCCGINGPDDYTNQTNLPSSCCTNVKLCVCTPEKAYKGCRWPIINSLIIMASIIVGLLVATAILCVLAVLVNLIVTTVKPAEDPENDGVITKEVVVTFQKNRDENVSS